MSPGPGEYDYSKETSTTKNKNGIKFGTESRPQTAKMVIKESYGPGPGGYNVDNGMGGSLSSFRENGKAQSKMSKAARL